LGALLRSDWLAVDKSVWHDQGRRCDFGKDSYAGPHLSRKNREHQSPQLTATDVAAPLTFRCLGWGRAEAHKAAGELATRDTDLSSEEASFMIGGSLPIERRILL
jgi:hypothetical protein